MKLASAKANKDRKANDDPRGRRRQAESIHGIALGTC